MTKAVTVPVACLPHRRFAQSGTWARQPAGTMAWLHALFFLDQNRGWAVGSKGTLLQTTDGGNTWKARNASTDDVVRDIFFIDDRNGWLVCEVNAYQLKTVDEPRAYLMKTTDGGEKWKRIEIKDFNIDAVLVRAVFTRSGRGWTFGEGGAIYATRDARRHVGPVAIADTSFVTRRYVR